jgi:hypothetical protein
MVSLHKMMKRGKVTFFLTYRLFFFPQKNFNFSGKLFSGFDASGSFCASESKNKNFRQLLNHLKFCTVNTEN